MGFNTDEQLRNVLTRWSTTGSMSRRNIQSLNHQMFNSKVLEDFLNKRPKGSVDYQERMSSHLSRGFVHTFQARQSDEPIRFAIHVPHSQWCSSYAKHMAMAIGS
eukprot:1821702-Amphidinium_carterae.1